MNNLKKVLALGLALVMLFSMFTVASAAQDEMVASDLADWDTVAHKDAVSLMVDLGIIKGIEADGKVSFQPAGNIDRASWAKMVYYAATGSEDADAYLGTASGLNDIAGNWAESYISYLKANQYISGDGAGNYNPSSNVTVAEACKMMLTVLGYDAEDRGYQNTAAWAGNIMTDAKRNGLMVNVDKDQTALVPLTRENAAEIVLNALNANMVEGIPQWDAGNRYITTYNKLYTLGYDVFGLVQLTATVDGIDKDGFATFSKIVLPKPEVTSISASSISGKVKATANLVGEDVNVYVKADGAKWDEKTGEIYATGTFQRVLSSSAAKANTTAVKVITSGIKSWTDLTTRGTTNFVATSFATAPEYYLNGKTASETEVKSAAANRGTVVEFYTNDDGEISVVKTYQYTVDQVENGEVTTKTLSNGTVQVRVPGVINAYTDTDKVSGWQGLAQDDVVLVYRTDLGNNSYSYTIEKAEKVTGKVTSFNSNGELTINGSKYRGSEQPASGTIGDVAFTALGNGNAQNIFANWQTSVNSDLSTEYDFYLDKNGAIVAGIQITESIDNSKICMVLQAEVPTSSMETASSLRAQLLFVDGTTEFVTVTKVGKLNVVETVRNEDRQISTDDALASLVGTNGSNAMTQFYTYRATSAGYELTELNDVNYPRNWENAASIGNGTAKVATVMHEGFFAKTPGAVVGGKDSNLAGWNITADDNTTFVVGKRNANDDTVAYTVYKGFKNVPTMDATMLTAICANTSSNPADVNTTAKFVYLETGAFKDDVPDGYILIRNNVLSIDPELADDGVYVVDIIDVDGKETTMRVTEDLRNAIVADSMILQDNRNYVGNFFAIGEIDENGVVSSLTNGAANPAERAVSLETLKAIGSGVITLTTEAYDYDDATKFVYVDMGWADNDETNNETGVREEALDKIAYNGADTFNPNGFFNENDVNTNAESGATYISVEAVVVCPVNSTTADYVYVLRTLW